MIWIEEGERRRKEILNQVAEQSGLIAQAIEKDWWVTQCLRVIFDPPVANHMIFKGGTSLSKGWGLIERFSEDIDLSVSRDFLGFGGDDISNSQIKKLRKASFQFVSGELATRLQYGLEALGIPADRFQLSVQNSFDSDVDPQSIYVVYQPTGIPYDYLQPRVKLEIGARAMMEPTEPRSMQSLIGQHYPQASFADAPFQVTSVLPKRTFLEKIFLLHELLQVNPEKTGDRLSRHLYDIDQLMDTVHGQAAFEDRALFQALANFRRRFNTVKHVDYDLHSPATLAFVPSPAHRKSWETDYRKLQESMIYGASNNFPTLIQRLEQLQAAFRNMNCATTQAQKTTA